MDQCSVAVEKDREVLFLLKIPKHTNMIVYNRKIQNRYKYRNKELIFDELYRYAL